jgi:hypothetical protein
MTAPSFDVTSDGQPFVAVPPRAGRIELAAQLARVRSGFKTTSISLLLNSRAPLH